VLDYRSLGQRLLLGTFGICGSLLSLGVGDETVEIECEGVEVAFSVDEMGVSNGEGVFGGCCDGACH
jgi:hypothetical protein